LNIIGKVKENVRTEYSETDNGEIEYKRV